MLETLKRYALRILNFCLIAAVALLIVDVLLGVASRYLWGAQIKWTEELATVTLIWVSFLGIAAAFEARAHLGIDLVTDRFTPGMQRKTALFIHIVTLLFVFIVFEIGGVKLVVQAIHHWNVLPALQVSDVIQYLPLPVSGLFILLFEVCSLRNDLVPQPETNAKEVRHD